AGSRRPRRVDGDLAAAEPLADVLVGVAFQRQRHAARDGGAEALPRGAVEVQLDRVLGQPLGPVLLGDLAADDGAYDAVDVADGQRALDLLALLDRRPADRQQRD